VRQKFKLFPVWFWHVQVRNAVVETPEDSKSQKIIDEMAVNKTHACQKKPYAQG
jgi:hypothetical protein